MLRARAILFDIDGTLVDSTPVVERSWRTWAQEHGVDADEVLRVCHGRRTEDTVAEFIAPQQLEAAVARLQELELADFDGVTALPGAQQILEALTPRRRAAVTSGERDLMTGRLSAAQLPIPETMICAEDVAVGKPSPEGYLLAAAVLGLDAKHCVVVEDAPARGETSVPVKRSLRDRISADPSVSFSGVMLVISRLRRPNRDSRRLPGNCHDVFTWVSSNDGKS